MNFGGLAVPPHGGIHDFASPPRGGFAFSGRAYYISLMWKSLHPVTFWNLALPGQKHDDKKALLLQVLPFAQETLQPGSTF